MDFQRSVVSVNTLVHTERSFSSGITNFFKNVYMWERKYVKPKKKKRKIAKPKKLWRQHTISITTITDSHKKNTHLRHAKHKVRRYHAKKKGGRTRLSPCGSEPRQSWWASCKWKATVDTGTCSAVSEGGEGKKKHGRGIGIKAVYEDVKRIAWVEAKTKKNGGGWRTKVPKGGRNKKGKGRERERESSPSRLGPFSVTCFLVTKFARALPQWGIHCPMQRTKKERKKTDARTKCRGGGSAEATRYVETG